MFGRVLGSLSGLFVTAVGVTGLWRFISQVMEVLHNNEGVTFWQILDQPGALEMLLILVAFIVIGLNLFIPNCVLFRKLCGKSCASSECTKTVETVKAE